MDFFEKSNAKELFIWMKILPFFIDILLIVIGIIIG